MPWSVDDVQLVVTMDDTGALGQDGDSSFLLKVVAVHGTLASKRDACLLEETVHQCCLAVINVSNDGEIPDLGHVFALKDLEHVLHLQWLLGALCNILTLGLLALHRAIGG